MTYININPQISAKNSIIYRISKNWFQFINYIIIAKSINYLKINLLRVFVLLTFTVNVINSKKFIRNEICGHNIFF